MSEGGERQWLFTVLCEFQGGTYVSQVRATDVITAVHVWANALNDEQSALSLPTDLALTILSSLEDFSPAPLKELRNVWCVSSDFSGSVVLLNIVETADVGRRRL